MKCPGCDGNSFQVIESRKAAEIVYRVRKCRVPECGWLATTHETMASVEDQSIPNSVRKPARTPA